MRKKDDGFPSSCRKGSAAMTTQEIFSYLVHTIHTVILATVDENGRPATCAIDMMDTDGQRLYFLTATGKGICRRLRENGHVALTGIHGESTMDSISISLQGRATELGDERRDMLFEKNPYLYELYPTEQSRRSLSVFAIVEGRGERFDLSVRPVERFAFSFGDMETTVDGFCIDDNCIGCGDCLSVCPQDCIEAESLPYRIVQANCLRCGACLDVCRYNAVHLR
jgi:uncharacterized pyridoxamine 5'-phosphate oxidase family protein/NAD-dependent dihydropyrimidine dehydrogenase PreA subunit